MKIKVLKHTHTKASGKYFFLKLYVIITFCNYYLKTYFHITDKLQFQFAQLKRTILVGFINFV